MCGKMFSSSLVLRDKCFATLENLCEYFKNNLIFSHTKLSDIYANFNQTYPNEFNALIVQMSEVGLKNSDQSSFTKYYYLKKEEISQIYNFAKEIGKGDESCALNTIESFRLYCENAHKNASIKRSQNQGLYYKLCVAVGMIVCILII